jgi:hypothetical protein
LFATGGKFAAGVVDTGAICHRYQLSTTLVKLVAKFAAGVVDTGGNLREFSKKFETALMVYSGAWGKLIHEKKPEAKNLVTLSL